MLCIRAVKAEDRALYSRLANEFYHSEAVLHPVSQAHIDATFCELMRENTYLDAQIIEYEGEVAGFALRAKTYSQEAGGLVVWLEELYLRPAFRACGLGKAYITWMLETRDPAVKRFRLEIEEDNLKAKSLYKKSGFAMLDYRQMYIDFD